MSVNFRNLAQTSNGKPVFDKKNPYVTDFFTLNLSPYAIGSATLSELSGMAFSRPFWHKLSIVIFWHLTTPCQSLPPRSG
jgi:hypothetical protein